MLKTLHLLIATLILGTQVINYCLIPLSQKHGNGDMTVKIAIIIDTIIVALLLAMFISGTVIVPLYHWNYHTPWIKAAYIFLTITTALWIANIFLKKSFLNKKPQYFLFHVINISLIILLIVIMNDAITKNTWIVS